MMPKFVAHRFEVRRELAGALSLRLIANQKEYRFDIAEHAVPQIREHLIRAFQLADPPRASADIPATAESPPGDTGVHNELRNFAVNAEPGRDWISLKFEMSNGGSIDMALPISIMELFFEAIGKGITVSKSEPTATRQ
jgi:hypothetical protein